VILFQSKKENKKKEDEKNSFSYKRIKQEGE
jgi:hypothetical protein